MRRNNSTLISSSWVENEVTSHYVLDLGAGSPSIVNDDLFSQVNIFGQFATVENLDNSTYICSRDPLGVGKMFYCHSEEEGLKFSERFIDLLGLGAPVYALPRGMTVQMNDAGKRWLVNDFSPTKHQIVTDSSSISTIDSFNKHPVSTGFKSAIYNRLTTVFKLIRSMEKSGYKVFVALSGGLDSSIIASFANSYLEAPVACTLDLGGSEDAVQAAKIARCLGIQHQVFSVSRLDILEAVDLAPALCQDYRDFNVHCAALNVLLAQNIKNWADKYQIAVDKRIILTGDLMNEFTCDYEEELVDDTVYYRLPRVGAKMLQRQLIGGLDTSDRENYPFKHYGFYCVQPYAAIYDLYLSLPKELITHKVALNRHLVDEEVLALLPTSKLRAQVGDKNSMGILGVCHQEGIDQRYFLSKLLGKNLANEYLMPILMGRYAVEKFISGA
jgi:asparagine synthetase B (glutamine-hydrolysing)